jgi:serine/threonine protein kinase
MNMGPYELLESIGKGGMGTVYLGRNPATGVKVAIKVMAADMAADPVLLKRFEQEFLAASRLHHPNIVRGLDFSVDAGSPYMVMEFVEGQNLGQRVRLEGPLSEAEAVRLTLQIAEALQLAHLNKLVHRDVKPDNVLLTKDGRAKLADLGLIKDLDAGRNLTRSRTCLGTSYFMAPEQFGDAKHVDARSDIYGLGATLYYALTGIIPFQGRGHLTVLRKKMQNELVPAIQLVPSLHPQVDRAIRQALDASPAGRPPSCQAFAKALAKGGPTSAEPVARAEASRPAASKAAAPEQGVDRRAAPRYPSLLDATCRPLHESKHIWIGKIEDISITGIRLQVSRRFEAGAVLAVEFLDDEANPISLRCVRVQWVRETTSRQWQIGCVFSLGLTEAELNVLLGGKPTAVVALMAG